MDYQIIFMRKAVKAGITVISTPHDSFETSRLIVQSIPVDYLMAKRKSCIFLNR